MSKIVQIKIFNDLINQFLDYLDANFRMFKSDILLIKNTIDFVRRSNPRLVVEQFMNYVFPFKTIIFECDEVFFLNFDNLKHILNSDDLMFGTKLRNIWMSPDTTRIQKAYIWSYMQKLLTTGEKIIY